MRDATPTRMQHTHIRLPVTAVTDPRELSVNFRNPPLIFDLLTAPDLKVPTDGADRVAGNAGWGRRVAMQIRVTDIRRGVEECPIVVIRPVRLAFPLLSRTRPSAQTFVEPSVISRLLDSRRAIVGEKLRIRASVDNDQPERANRIIIAIEKNPSSLIDKSIEIIVTIDICCVNVT